MQYKRITIGKSAAETAVLRKLRAFLDANEPQLVYILTNLWRTQGRAITYKVLREAILAGDISADLFEDWQQDYVKFVTEHLKPAWETAMAEAARGIEAKRPEWSYEPMAEGVREWVDQRGAAFVTNSTQAQIEGIRAVVRRAAVHEMMSVDQLARAVRPMVGLTHQQGIANLNYYTNLIEKGTSQKRAQDLSMRYAARQHRYRGYNIARTELAFAYNQGAYEGVKQAQQAGYMGDTVKRWCTADDERVCRICGRLEGTTAGMDEDFTFYTRLAQTEPTIKRVPPAHPSCRCAVLFEEITPPIFG